MNKQQLASKIWESANKMRSKIEANEYKDYILGFIFYKYLSDTEVKFLRREGSGDKDIENLSENSKIFNYVKTNIGYGIAYNNLYSTWIKKGSDFDISNVYDALNAFGRNINNSHKKVFDSILNTLQTGLSKLGDTSKSQTKAASDLIHLINVIPMDGKQDYDVLGFIYEYLISMFAANAGKKAGEFYTPHEVSLLMSEIVANHVKNKKEIKIFDPTSGSGSLLINIGRSVARHMDNDKHIKYYAQEIKENTYNLTRMNLIMRGILPDNIVTRNGDTLENDWPYFEDNDPVNTYNPLYVDAVVSNPPYSQAWDSENKDSDPRFTSFGIAPKTKADFAFLLHDLYHLNHDGIMTIVLPHGVLFRGGEEGSIRKNLVEQNNIDTIIGLPPNIFFGTGIPTIIMVLKKKKANNDLLIIDASKGFKKVGKNNVLRASDIKKIADTVISRKNIDKFSKIVSLEEIKQNEYNLNIPRYVDSSEPAETWDIYASMFGGIPKSEIAAFDDYWNTFESLKHVLFKDKGTPYYDLAVDDTEKAIKENSSVLEFKNKFNKGFNSLSQLLKRELIEKWETISINQGEALISKDIFKRLEKIELVDPYSAYQVLDDEWATISIDLEILQTEKFSAVKKVDPNMVYKKKDGRDQEVQDGWVGHVIPFELVQSTILKKETGALRKKEERLIDIQSSCDEIIDSLSEEDKEIGVLNEAKDAFSFADLNKKIKELFGPPAEIKLAIKKYDEDSIERKLIQAQKLMEEEKELKAQVRKLSGELHLLTKKTIENLTDQEAIKLLEEKWITPLLTSLNKIPDNIVTDFSLRIRALVNKYNTTYNEVAEQITDTKLELSKLIDGLTCNKYDMLGLKKFQSLLKSGK